MNKNTISKWFSMFVLMMAGITGATAQSLTVADATLVPGKTKVVSISLDAAEGQTIYGIQTDITLSKGLKINAATAANTALHFNQNKLESGATRVALLSLGGEAIPAGEAIKLTIEADASFKNGTIDLANTKLTTTATGTEIDVDATSAIIDTYDCLPYQKYIIGNYTSEKFLGAGNGWGTQASLVAHPEYVKLDYNEADGTYKLESQVSNGGNKYYFNGDYMDSNAPVSLTLKKIEEPLGYQDEEETKPIFGYTISDGDNYYGWDGTSTVLGKNLSATDENAIWLIMPLDEAKAGLVNATLEEPLDATMLIEDHDFGRNNRYQDKWTMVASNQNLSGGEDKNGTIGNNCAESWHSTFTLSQTLADAPAGIYALTAQGFYGQDGSDNEHLPVFYANDATQTFPLKTGSEASMTAASQSFSAGMYTIEPLVFEVKDGETLTIGAKLEGNTALWCIWDNFTLTYYGKNTTIEDVKAESLRKQVDDLREKAFSLFNETEVESIKAVLENAINSTESVSGAEAINNAIATLKTAIEKGEASLEAKAKLAKMKELIDATNVYTAEAKNAYYDQWVVKYNDGTITKTEANALQDPFLVTGWRANVTVDNFLLSAWDTNPDFQDAAYYINTWSKEGETDGSNFKVPFFEYFGNPLPAKTLTATMNGLEPGNYDVTAWVRVAAADKTATSAKGVTLQVNAGDSINVCDGEQFDCDAERFFIKEVTATGVVAEDGVLKIQFHVAENNDIHWLSFKNVKFEKKAPVILTLNAPVGEEVTLTFGVYDTEDTFTVDFGGENNTQKAKVGVNNAGPVKEDGTTGSATKFTGTVGGDGTITVSGYNDIWYLTTTNGAMPTTFDQPKLMNVVQMSITGADVESVALPAYPKMTQFSFNNSSAKSVDVTKVPTLTSLTINSTTASKFEPQLESIDLSKNTELTYLSLQGNTKVNGKLTTLDLTNNTKLDGMGLYVQYNALTEIKLGENTLSAINVQNNQLTSLDWTKLTGLKNIYASNNKLAGEADLSANAKFENVQLNNNELTSVKVPNVTKQLAIEGNKLTLATIPAQPAGLNTKSKTGKFTYASQAAMQVAETVSELDLTSQLTVAKGELDPADYATYLTATTTFSFVTAGGNALVEGTDYEVVEPGKFKFLKDQEEKVHAVMLNAALPKFTEAAPFTTTEFTVKAAVEELDPDLVEIPLDQGKTLDDFARTELVEGENYNTYTCTEGIQVAFKMFDIDVKNCDFVVVKFAEPVAAGWELAFWAKNDNSTVAVPAGATEFKYVFAEDAKCAIVDGVLPQICMLHLWTGTTPLVAKVKGVYKHKLPVADAISNIATDAQKTAVFNMNGQKVNKAQKGLFIINGKKVVIK